MHQRAKQNGFSLLELLVSMAITLTVMGAAMMLYQKSVQVANFATSRAEMQSGVRSAMNQITRDLNQAGTGIPLGGIPIPSAAAGGINPVFACDAARCYITTGNTFTTGTLNKVTPANDIGVTTSEATDAVVMVYMDPIAPTNDPMSSATGLDWSPYTTTTIADDGSNLTMPAGTTPALNDPQKGLVVGDLLLMQNDKGSALGVVTGFDAASRKISFAAGDPLKFNQPAATPISGTLGSLRISPLPASGAHYKPTSVSRIMMITYFIWRDPNDGHLMLMRQVNARTPSPVAENIEDLQITYDVLDDSKSPAVLTANLPDAATGSPLTPRLNQIRKINLVLTARSPRPNAQGLIDRTSIATSVGPRNLSFRDRYN
jgi:prepilin-type N-terminal cleavage/methylation domain-containing protein